MAVATTRANVAGPSEVMAVSGKATSVVAVTDATAAQSSEELMRPQSVTDSTITVINLGDSVSRALIRARLLLLTTAVSASPVIRVYAIIGADDDDWTTGVPLRLDNVDSDAAGKTLTLPATPSDTNMLRDGTYRYSDVISLTAEDLQGATHLVILVETAASITGGGCDVEVVLQN